MSSPLLLASAIAGELAATTVALHGTEPRLTGAPATAVDTIRVEPRRIAAMLTEPRACLSPDAERGAWGRRTQPCSRRAER